MFGRLGSLTYRFRYLVVAGWIALAAGAVLLAPSLAQEGLTNQSAFLPAGTESVLARDALERAFPGATAASSASLAFARDAGLSDADRAYIAATADWLTSADAPAVVRDAVAGIATVDSRPELAAMLRSADGKLEMVAVNLDVTAAGSGAEAVISAIRDHLGASAPAGLDAHVTGTAAISTDYLAAIVKGTESTTIVTIVLVVIILLLIYRAPLAALVPLITIGAAFLVSRGVLGDARRGRLAPVVAARHVRGRPGLRRRHGLRDLPDLAVPRGGLARRLAQRVADHRPAHRRGHQRQRGDGDRGSRLDGLRPVRDDPDDGSRRSPSRSS